jgi:hypothetical protein
MLLKEKKSEKNAKKEDKHIYILLEDDNIATIEFKNLEDKNFLKNYLKRKRKQLKEINMDYNLM